MDHDDEFVLPPMDDVVSLSAELKKYKAKKEKEIGALTQWTQLTQNVFSPTTASSEILPAGVYDLLTENFKPVFSKRTISNDDIMQFPDSKADKILKEIEEFWDKADRFKKYGFLHRRGYLMHGPAGCGKSYLIYQIANRIIERNGVVFMVNHPSKLSSWLSLFRAVEPNRNIVCVFEDIDTLVSHHGDAELLAFLDGDIKIDRVLNIATTNYPERLDKRLRSRPRRFDRVIQIDMPTEATRRMYFEKKLKIEEHELDTWVKETNDFSFAAMAELVMSVKCLDNDFKETIEKLRALMDDKISSDDYEEEKKMGFSTGDE